VKSVISYQLSVKSKKVENNYNLKKKHIFVLYNLFGSVMNKMKKYSLIYGLNRRFMIIASLLVLFVSCEEEKSLEDALKEGFTMDSTAAAIEIAPEVLESIIRGISSPLEIASLIRESGAEYTEGMLNPTKNIENYSSHYKKALNLGLYGTDLGYINIYDQQLPALDFLSVVKRLADDLSVGHFFDFSTIKRLATNNENIDSMLNITTQGFEHMTSYLTKQHRGNVSVLILTGGWVEALYIATQVNKRERNEKLLERIGEQKITLNELILLLSVYQSDFNIGKLLADIKELKKIFDQVEITYTYQEPIMQEIDGELVIIDQSSSQVHMSKELFENIFQKTKLIRNKIIS